MMKKVWVVSLLLISQNVEAQNREPSLELERGKSNIHALEKESSLERDLLGRKVVIDPDSKIDPDSLYIAAAPGSTVIVRAQQYDIGTQKVDAPNYKNVEFPNPSAEILK